MMKELMITIRDKVLIGTIKSFPLIIKNSTTDRKYRTVYRKERLD